MSKVLTGRIIVRDQLASLSDRLRAFSFKSLLLTLKQSRALSIAARHVRLFFKVSFASLCFFAKSILLIVKYVFRHPVQVSLNGIFLFSLMVMAVTGSEINERVILSQISEDTVKKLIEASQFNRGFSNEELKRGGVRELTSAGAPAWVQREGIRAILYQARKAGLSIEDQAVLLAIANIESGFNPFAQANISTACGLFQFIQSTGEMMALKSAECMDPWKNAEAGVNHYIANFEARVRRSVENLVGTERAFRSFELSYYLHHDGPASSNPSNEVKAIVIDGSQFLFSAYHALQKEAEFEKSAPSFSHLFTKKMWTFISGMTEYFAPRSIPLIAWILEDESRETAQSA